MHSVIWYTKGCIIKKVVFKKLLFFFHLISFYDHHVRLSFDSGIDTKEIIKITEKMFEFTENDLGEQTETHGMGESYLLTQKSDFDLKLAEKWSQLMKKGSFRYCS